MTVNPDDAQIQDGEVGLIVGPEGEFRVIINAEKVLEFQLILLGLYDAMECDERELIDGLIDRGVEKMANESNNKLH